MPRQNVLCHLSPLEAAFIATWLKLLDLYCAVGVLSYCHSKGRDDMWLGLQPDILKILRSHLEWRKDIYDNY
jgi:hypothetical protein